MLVRNDEEAGERQETEEEVRGERERKAVADYAISLARVTGQALDLLAAC